MYSFSKDTEEKFQWLLTRYPKKDAVLLPLLHFVQDEAGYLTPDAIDHVAERLGLSPGRVREVASFYSMFRLNQKGKYVLQVCHNLSCYLGGAEDIIKKCKELLGIKEGETTADGLFSLERVECLAACNSAPVMQVNCWDYHEHLTTDKIERIVGELKQGKAAKPAFDARMKEGGTA